jgi:hypothetical protein
LLLLLFFFVVNVLDIVPPCKPSINLGSVVFHMKVHSS